MADRGTYIKMSDSLPEHRKIVAAGGDAAWLHVCAMAYCSRNLTDGFIPAEIVPRLSDRRQPARLAARLCEVNLWHAAGHDCKRCAQPPASTYVIHDYLEHQRSAARVAEVSASRAEAGRRGGSKSKPKPKQVASSLDDASFADAKANADRSFAEGVLRTPQTEADAVPPSAGAPPARRSRHASNNAGDVIAAYVQGAVDAGLDRPSEQLRQRVGRDANLLLQQGYPLAKLTGSAYRMGAGKWNDLGVQMRKDDAEAKGVNSNESRQSTTDQRVAQAQALKAEIRGEGSLAMPPMTIQGRIEG